MEGKCKKNSAMQGFGGFAKRCQKLLEAVHSTEKENLERREKFSVLHKKIFYKMLGRTFGIDVMNYRINCEAHH